MRTNQLKFDESWSIKVTGQQPDDDESMILKKLYSRFPSLRPRRLGTKTRVQVIAGLRLVENTSTDLIIASGGGQ